jgi:broad specificity phosphatase PhoE
MIHLYFIRHAESEANKQRILASRQPFPLTAAGRDDAGRIASELKGLVPIDKIISSPLSRAQQTAEVFCNEFNLTLSLDERLSEQDLGPYSGMNYDEVKKEPEYEMNPLARWSWVPGGIGESYSMVADRVLDFLELMNQKQADKHILIVTHAVVFRLLRAALENTLPIYPKDFPNNGEIWKVRFQGLGFRHDIESIFLGDSRNFVHNP